MKKLIFTLIITIASITSYAQLKLPTVGTTDQKASSDLAKGITNEMWFTTNNNSGNVVFNKYFKSTPVGIKHAYTAFENLKSDYNASFCKDESTISNLAKKEDGSIDYEMLSITIKSESSEIDKFCALKDNLILGFSLKSIQSDDVNYLVLFIVTSKKAK